MMKTPRVGVTMLLDEEIILVVWRQARYSVSRLAVEIMRKDMASEVFTKM